VKNVTANRSVYLNISRIEKNTKELRDIEQKRQRGKSYSKSKSSLK
jgi:hypothetical protein